MRVHGEKEGNEKVVRVPERLIALLTDLCVCRGVHEQHAEEHDMASNASSLRVMDLHCGLRPHH